MQREYYLVQIQLSNGEWQTVDTGYGQNGKNKALALKEKYGYPTRCI